MKEIQIIVKDAPVEIENRIISNFKEAWATIRKGMEMPNLDSILKIQIVGVDTTNPLAASFEEHIDETLQ